MAVPHRGGGVGPRRQRTGRRHLPPTVLTALQEVEDNLTAATALAQEQQLQTEALAAAQRALDVVSNQYRAGTVGYLNVITAQATVLSAQRSLIDVRSRRLAAVNTLLKNVAGRWEVEAGDTGACAADC